MTIWRYLLYTFLTTATFWSSHVSADTLYSVTFEAPEQNLGAPNTGDTKAISSVVFGTPTVVDTNKSHALRFDTTGRPLFAYDQIRLDVSAIAPVYKLDFDIRFDAVSDSSVVAHEEGFAVLFDIPQVQKLVFFNGSDGPYLLTSYYGDLGLVESTQVPFPLTVWQHFHIVASVAQQTWTIFINGQQALTGPFLARVNSVNAIRFSAGNSGSATISYLDNIVLQAVFAPVISASSSVNLDVVAGQSVTIHAPAPTGTGPFTFQWYKDGNPLSGATANPLVIQSAIASDQGSYSVRIVNDAGSATGPQVYLRVMTPLSPLAIVDPGLPADVTATVEATVLLQAPPVTGTSPLSYQWYKDGAPLPGANGSILAIDPASAATQGAYRVIISNSVGSIASRTAAVVTVSAAHLQNISTRSYVGDGGDVMIAGFIIAGSTPKTVVIRASGPALQKYDVSGFLADPVLDVHNSNGLIAINDNWDASQLKSVFAAVGIDDWSTGSSDAALVLTLPPGAYTAIVSGKEGSKGVALVEVFATDSSDPGSRLINVSSRSLVKTGSAVQIAGFIIRGSGAKRVLIKASGPALAKYSVPTFIRDPLMTLYQGSIPLDTNDDWSPAIKAAIESIGGNIFASGSRDAALVETLNPGAYTVVVSGKGEGTGVALVEVFELPD